MPLTLRPAGLSRDPNAKDWCIYVRSPSAAVGVSYTYADGAREAHAVSTDDWPVIRKLRDAGKLSYADDEVREGTDEIARRGLDR